MTPGKLIAFEGGEGCGKSTQARLLNDYLLEAGQSAIATREPGGTPGAEAIRRLLLEPPGDGWHVESEALLFAAARSDHVARLIGPALAEGRWVVCDRFIDSSRAYQGGAGTMDDTTILNLHSIGSGGLRPDLTILLTIPDGMAAERLALRDGGFHDAIGGRSAAYHANVARSFRSFAKDEPKRFTIVDGSQTIEKVHGDIVAAVEARLGPVR